MTKIDFRKSLAHLYRPSSREFEVLEVPSLSFLKIDGCGDPNTSQAYQEAVEALYAVAYRLKFLSKRALGQDYIVPPLEGLWWAENMDHFANALDKNAWEWSMMIMQPEWISQGMLEETIQELNQKKTLPALPKLVMENYHEGLSVQILYIGSYADEGPTLFRMHHEFIPQHGFQEAGKHHEIYLSDPRKVAPEKLRTILRQPVCPAGKGLKRSK